MKRIAALVVLSLFVLTAPALAAGKLHAGWKDAKAGAEKELKAAGLKKLSSYVKFNQDLGPNLDKLEAMAGKGFQDMTLEQIRKDKKMSQAMLDFSKKRKNEENWLYYTGGYKMKPEKVFDEFISRSAKHELNLDAALTKQWDVCKKSKQWKPCEKLRDEVLDKVTGMLLNESLGEFRAHMSSLASKERGPLKEKILKTSGDYANQVEKMDKKADKAKDILRKELSDIEKAVQKIK